MGFREVWGLICGKLAKKVDPPTSLLDAQIAIPAKSAHFLLGHTLSNQVRSDHTELSTHDFQA